MVARLVTKRQRLANGFDPALVKRQHIRRVIPNPVATALRLERKGEGGVTADVDGPDRVHRHQR